MYQYLFIAEYAGVHTLEYLKVLLVINLYCEKGQLAIKFNHTFDHVIYLKLNLQKEIQTKVFLKSFFSHFRNV